MRIYVVEQEVLDNDEDVEISSCHFRVTTQNSNPHRFESPKEISSRFHNYDGGFSIGSVLFQPSWATR